MRAVFPVAVAVNLKVPATMTALQSIDGFPLHEMKMTVPPFLTTGIRAEPQPFSSGNLLHLLTAAFANRFRLYRHSCLLPRYRRSAAKRLHGVFGQSDELRDFLVSLALPTKVFYFCFLIVCHRSAPSLQQKGQKYRFLADFPTAIKITSIKEPRQRKNFMGFGQKNIARGGKSIHGQSVIRIHLSLRLCIMSCSFCGTGSPIRAAFSMIEIPSFEM